jgi:hypothetical protein
VKRLNLITALFWLSPVRAGPAVGPEQRQRGRPALHFRHRSRRPRRRRLGLGPGTAAMNENRRRPGRRQTAGRLVLIVALSAAVLLLAFGGLAAFQGGYQLDWWTVDGGGGESSGGNVSLAGSIGQPDAGDMSSGIYTLGGGFWDPVESGQLIYLPVILGG